MVVSGLVPLSFLVTPTVGLTAQPKVKPLPMTEIEPISEDATQSMPSAALPQRIETTIALDVLSLDAPLSHSATGTVVETPSPTAAAVTVVATDSPENSGDPVASETIAPQAQKDKTQPAEDPEVVRRRQLMIEADRLYQAGDRAAAESLYRQAKDPLWTYEGETLQQPEPLLEPENLPPAGQVYWRESTAGLEAGLETRVLVPLELLVEAYPEFVPGHIRLAEALIQYERPEAALDVLERATALYPNQADLVQTRIAMLVDQEDWLEASIAARQFALLHPEHPQSAELMVQADQYLDEFQSDTRREVQGNAIANVITGAVGYALTGSLLGPFSGLNSTLLLLRGEETVGDRAADQARDRLPMVEDEAVVAYVNEIGQRLAQVTGRDDFEYEFFVVRDDRLNAFALPGGKVFINAGAILQTNSEAELAGLLAHELAHTVLSHGFQLVTSGNLTANLTQYLPLGGTIANLLVMDYSRSMERQADVMGTQILVSANYAADGMHNLMVTLAQQEKNRPAFSWLSSHPYTEDRVAYLEALIEEQGYNRYTYEGVERHLAIQERVRSLLKKHQSDSEHTHQRH